jgi:hypothetical protein
MIGTIDNNPIVSKKPPMNKKRVKKNKFNELFL